MPYDPYKPTLEPLEARRLLSASPILGDRSVPDGFAATINFQPADLGSVDNTRADFGRPYGLRGNGLTYGWSRNLDTAGDVVDRESSRDLIPLTRGTIGNAPEGSSQEVDKRYDTVALVDPGDEWSIAVPDDDATYAVALVAGDPDFDDPGVLSIRWEVNGEPALRADAFARWPFAEGVIFTQPVDGKITLRAENTSVNNSLLWLRVAEVEPLPDYPQGIGLDWAIHEPENEANVPTSPIRRIEGNSTVLDGRLYMIGGFQQDYTDTYRRVDTLDLATHEWSRGTDLPDGAGDTHAAIAADSQRGLIHWIGGQVGTGSNEDFPGTATAWSYDPAADSWTALPSLPEVRAGGTAVLVGDRLHYMGGVDETGVVTRPEHWSLDLSAPANERAWEPMLPLPYPVDHVDAEVVEGIGSGNGPAIVVVGGEYAHIVGYAPVAQTQIYDVNTPEWTLGAPPPFGTSHTQLVQAEGRIWNFGGQRAAQVVVESVFSYDPIADTWAMHDDMPQTRKAGYIFFRDDAFHYLAGDTYTAGYPFSTMVGTIQEDEPIVT